MKKSLGSDPAGILSVLRNEDADAMRAYTKFCGQLYQKLSKSVQRGQGYLPTPGTNEVCIKLKRLFGLNLCQRHETSRKDDVSEPYHYTLGMTFYSDAFLPVIQELLSNKPLLPYIVHRCFGHKSRSNKPPLKSMRDFMLLWNSPKIAEFVLATCPILKPSFLYKLTKKYAKDPEKAATFWGLYLDRVKSICGKPGGKEALRTLYELRHLDAMRKSRAREKEVRGQVHLPKDCGEAVFALVDARYGYVLAHACRVLSLDTVQKIVKKYDLPTNVLSVELSHPYSHKSPVEALHRLVRDDLKSSDWVWLKTDAAELRIKAEESKRMRAEEEEKKRNGGEKKETKTRFPGRKGRKGPAWKPKKLKMNVRQRRKLPLPSYVQEMQYRITCPIIELIRRDLRPEIDIEKQILSLPETHRKLAIHDLTYYLCKHGRMTMGIFSEFWRTRAETEFIHKMRPDERLPVYQFLGGQEMETMIEVLMYDLPQGEGYISHATSVWLTLACRRRDLKVMNNPSNSETLAAHATLCHQNAPRPEGRSGDHSGTGRRSPARLHAESLQPFSARTLRPSGIIYLTTPSLSPNRSS